MSARTGEIDWLIEAIRNNGEVYEVMSNVTIVIGPEV
jgi:hypothetical protein